MAQLPPQCGADCPPAFTPSIVVFRIWRYPATRNRGGNRSFTEGEPVDLRSLHEAAQIADPVDRARALTQLMTADQGLVTEAAKYRRHAIAEARAAGLTLEQIGARLGVTPGRVSQIAKDPAAKAPAGSAEPAPRVLVQRALPTDPAVRGSVSLFLVEAERQGITAERQMLLHRA